MLLTVPRMVSILKDARSVSKNLVPALQCARRRFPASAKSSIEEFAICWLMAPDGDRRHGPKSRGVVNEVSTLKRNQDIVRVFVLREDGLDLDGRTLRPAPIQHALERPLGRHDSR